MSSQHIPDNDVTFIYVRELNDSIKTVSSSMKEITGEIHSHSLSLFQLREQMTTMTRNMERVMGLLYDGHNHKPAMVTRIDELERDIRDVERERSDEKSKAKEERNQGRSFGNSVRIAIFAAILSLTSQVVQWYFKYNAPPTPPGNNVPSTGRP